MGHAEPTATSGHHNQHPQHRVAALAAMACAGKPMSRADVIVLRIRGDDAAQNAEMVCHPMARLGKSCWLSRNRNWAHPDMVALLERLSVKAHEVAGWRGLLVGDMSQPRGGPMLTGHASHQIGLDADIWLTPMPKRQLSRNEREEMSATNMVRADRLDIDPAVWTPTHLLVIRAAAQEPRVERIFVNAAIKKALCREAKGDRSWLAKIRPWYGHDYHFHVRITCPPGDSACTPQPPPSESEGCASADLAYWFTDPVIHPKPSTAKPAPPITLSQLPAACRQILLAP